MAMIRKFGTFGGVFTPSILTILGVIMYMRLPMIVGEAGLAATLGIIAIAHVISLTTGLSVSSIATDKKVKGGGTYYMISRSLGLPIGGTLGIALFVGLSFSVSLYLIGFAESFLAYWNFEVTKEAIRITGTIVLLVVTAVTLISTSLAIRTQYIIMAAIVLSLASVLLGRHDLGPGEMALPTAGGAIPLMVLFGIFFPAVTGFEAGVSMSGDLRDPKKSIPVGSLSAIIVGFVVYLGLAWFFASTVDAAVLAKDPEVLLKIALSPELVVAGIWGATLSSALGSILGAPRILQATAVDKITPSVFGRGSGEAGEPRNALILTFVIAEAGILIGELDMIARIVSIFFITTYGFLNLSCAFEGWTSADFRPDFRAPIAVSLLGAAACLIVMIQLDLLAAIGGTIVLGGLFLYLKRKELRLETGDAWEGVWASLVKTGVDKLATADMHERNWRPNIVMFRGKESERGHLHAFGRSITGRLGILSSFELVEQADAGPVRIEAVPDEEGEDLHCFRHVCPDLFTGIEDVVRLYGFSGVQPNTVLMGWSKRERMRERFADLLGMLMRTDMNAIFLSAKPDKPFGSMTTIDVWWSERGSNVAFAVTLLRLLTTSTMWRTARMRLLAVNTDPSKSERVYRTLRRILEEYRIGMEVRVIDNDRTQLSFEQLVQRESAATDLTIIGLPDRSIDSVEGSIDRMNALLASIGTAAVVYGSSSFEDLDAGIDEPVETADRPAERERLTLPDIPAAASPVLAADIEKIDRHGNRVLRVFFEKVVRPWMSEEREKIGEFRRIGESAYESLRRSSKFPESYRRRRAILRIQNEFLYRSRTLVGSIKDDVLQAQQASIDEGVAWYAERLQQDVERFPKVLRLQYPAEDLHRAHDDTAGITLRKAWKRTVHAIAKNPVTRILPYRTMAEHYLLHTRHLVLQSYLSRFRSETAEHLAEFKNHMLAAASDLAEIEDLVAERPLTPGEIDARAKAFAERAAAFVAETEARERLYERRLQFEFRKNLIAFQGLLSRFDAPERFRRLRVAPKAFKRAVQANTAFGAAWTDATGRVIDKIVLDMSVASLRGRVSDRMDEFASKVVQDIEATLVSPLKSLRSELLHGMETGTETPMEFDVERAMTLTDALDEAHEDILELTRAMPETLRVLEGSGDGQAAAETVEIPVIRLTQHFIESDLISPVQRHLGRAVDRLRKAGYSTRDQINLTRFGLDNVESDGTDRSAAMKGIYERAIRKVDTELENVRGVQKELRDTVRTSMRTAFAALAPHMIGRSAQEFTEVLRDYQSRKVATAFGRGLKQFTTFFEERVVGLVYKRSEGLLLARRLSGPTSSSLASTVLGLTEACSPRPRVLTALPQFYLNLFSGRSSIGDEFWIDREREQEEFEDAVRRYAAGYKGAVILLGDRQAGKTAFCRNVAPLHFRKQMIFHVFPPREGSIAPETFAQTLARSTGFQGTPDDIIRSLPRGSVVFFHDLELWFERHPGGTGVLGALRRLIESHAQDVLFVLNTTGPAFDLVSRVEPFRELALATITLEPMSARQLQALVTLRHQSSGMEFQYDDHAEHELSGIRKARIFDAGFEASGGNPGVMLNLWMAGIEHVRDRTLVIRKPELPPSNPLRRLSDDWTLVLTQFVLHKRLSKDKLARVMRTDAVTAQQTLRRMFAAGLLEERTPGLYMINAYLDPLVWELLRERRLI